MQPTVTLISESTQKIMLIINKNTDIKKYGLLLLYLQLCIISTQRKQIFELSLDSQSFTGLLTY